MANSQGKAYVFGSPAEVTLYTAANSITPVVSGSVAGTANEGFDISHECDVEEVKNTSGEIVSQIVSNNRLTLTLNMVPSGSTAAAALLQTYLGEGNGTATISGAKNVTCGGIDDAINTSTSGRWIYAGGGSVKFTNSGKAMLSLTLKKYPTATLMPGTAITL